MKNSTTNSSTKTTRCFINYRRHPKTSRQTCNEGSPRYFPTLTRSWLRFICEKILAEARPFMKMGCATVIIGSSSQPRGAPVHHISPTKRIREYSEMQRDFTAITTEHD